MVGSSGSGKLTSADENLLRRNGRYKELYELQSPTKSNFELEISTTNAATAGSTFSIGFAIGFISKGFLIAGIGQVVSSILSEHYGWNAVFYSLAVVYAVTAILVFFFLPKGGIQQAHANIWEPIKQIGKVSEDKNIVP